MNKGLKEKILRLRKEGNSYNEISEKLNCAKSTVSFHCSKQKGHVNPSKKISNNIIDKAKVLYISGLSTKKISIILNISQTTIRNNVDIRPKLTEEEIKKRNYDKVKSRRKVVKEILVDIKGGKCQNCGYEKCIAALDFHHRDESKKSFSLSTAGLSRSLSKLKKEVEKCDLLCANCHREVHYLGV